MFPLAYADASDSTQANFIAVLLCAAGLAVVGGLTGFAILLGKRNRSHDLLITIAALWGVVSAGTIVYTVMAQLKWSQDHLLDLQSGYGNPRNVRRPLPWESWAALAAVYVLLLLWAGRKKA